MSRRVERVFTFQFVFGWMLSVVVVYFVIVAVCGGYMRFMTFFALNELATGKLKLKMKESGKNNIFLRKNSSGK